MEPKIDDKASPPSPQQPIIELRRRAFDQSEFDKTFGKIDAPRPKIAECCNTYASKRCGCDLKSWQTRLFFLFPFFQWLPKYNLNQHLLADVLSGLTIGIMKIPQGMAYAALVGVDPVYGLYTSLVPSVVYFFFGTSAHIALGVQTIVALMVGSARRSYGFPDGFSGVMAGNNSSLCSGENFSATTRYDPIEVITTLSFLVGICLLVMRLFRLGFVYVFLSDQIIGGFTTAGALIVLTTQLGRLMGVQQPPPVRLFYVFVTCVDLIKLIPSTHIPTLIISLVCIVVLYVVKYHINTIPKLKRFYLVPIPIDLIVIIVATLGSRYGHFQQNYNVSVVLHVPKGLPPVTLPNVSLFWLLLVDAIAISVVVFSISISLAKLFAKKYRYNIDPNQELTSYSILAFVNSLFSSWCPCACFARSSVQASTGAKTPVTGLVSSLVVLVVLLWLAPYLEMLPNCVLSSIIIVALRSMLLQFVELKHLWPIAKVEFFIWLFSCVATLCLDAAMGLAASVAFAIATVAFRTQRPLVDYQGQVPESELYRGLESYAKVSALPGIVVFRFDAPLYFANAALFRDKLYAKLSYDPTSAAAATEPAKTGFFQCCRRDGDAGDLPSSPVSTCSTDSGTSSCIVRQTQMFFNNNSKPKSHAATKATVAVSNSNGISHQIVSIGRNKETEFVKTMTSPNHVIIDGSPINFIDLAGAAMLKIIYSELCDAGVHVAFAGFNVSIMDMFQGCEFHDSVPKNRFFVSVHDAVTTAYASTTSN